MDDCEHFKIRPITFFKFQNIALQIDMEIDIKLIKFICF